MDIENKDIYMNTTKFYIDKNGTKKYRNSKGELYREDGPACEYSNGSKFWYKEGLCHREDGPAMEFSTGTKSWWKEGKQHRLDGPAYEWGIYGHKDWYILNEPLKEKEFNSWILRIKIFI